MLEDHEGGDVTLTLFLCDLDLSAPHVGGPGGTGRDLDIVFVLVTLTFQLHAGGPGGAGRDLAGCDGAVPAAGRNFT